MQIDHRRGTEELQINQRQPPSGGTFQSLGSFEFDKLAVVTLNNAGDGALVADSVKLVPLGEGEHPELETLATEVEATKAQLEAKKKEASNATEVAISVEEEASPDDYHVCVRGNVHELGEIVPRGFLSEVSADIDDDTEIPAGTSGRLELAQWIADENNPLTARVFVNRVWHYLFGAGLVRTVDNFGTMGERPSHPELLDYLAIRFMENGWRIKPLIREIVLSRTWQLRAESDMRNVAAATRTELQNADPDNRLLMRYNLRRLDAEAIYDSILSLSGSLDTTIGGPTVREGTKSEYGYEFDVGRRAMYVPVFRNRLHGLFAVFDFPDPNLSLGRRTTSTLSTQSLFIMNSPFVLEQAALAAERLLAEDVSDGDRLVLLYERGLGRPPIAEERHLAEAFLRDTHQSDEESRRELWTQLCQTVIGCIDFRYVR